MDKEIQYQRAHKFGQVGQCILSSRQGGKNWTLNHHQMQIDVQMKMMVSICTSLWILCRSCPTGLGEKHSRNPDSALDLLVCTTIRCPLQEQCSGIPSGELTFCHGKSPFLMGKSTISMAIFHCYVSSLEGIIIAIFLGPFRHPELLRASPRASHWENPSGVAAPVNVWNDLCRSSAIGDQTYNWNSSTRMRYSQYVKPTKIECV